MFTLEQIKEAHSRVKTGADFPAYAHALAQLGVVRYETYVTDGNTTYAGNENEALVSGPRFKPLHIADVSNIEKFKGDILLHQQGVSDFPTIRTQAAASGVEKWIVDLQQMTCSYYDTAGNTILVERIPQPSKYS